MITHQKKHMFQIHSLFKRLAWANIFALTAQAGACARLGSDVGVSGARGTMQGAQIPGLLQGQPLLGVQVLVAPMLPDEPCPLEHR